jgi:hypothetical protein
MRLLNQATVIVLLALSWTALGAQSGTPIDYIDRHSKSRTPTIGSPQSIETGNEQIIENQGFLKCAAEFLTIQYQHGDTNQASANLVVMHDKTHTAVIVGHGGRGVQCTGDGDHCGQDAKILAYYNVPTWEPILSKLRGDFLSLTLLGCNIGTGTEGAIFLTAAAKATQMPVKAPDRMIFCGPQGITLIDGSPVTWIEVAPDGTVHEQHKESRKPTKHEVGRFKIGKTYQSVSMSEVTLLEFQYRGYRSSEFRALHAVDMSPLLSLIDFEHPIETKARPGAIATGKLRLGLKLGSNITEKNFVLYNDELLEDVAEPDVFYEGTDSLADYITRLTR